MVPELPVLPLVTPVLFDPPIALPLPDCAQLAMTMASPDKGRAIDFDAVIATPYRPGMRSSSHALGLGWLQLSTAEAGWYDDVVISTSRFGCQ